MISRPVNCQTCHKKLEDHESFICDGCISRLCSECGSVMDDVGCKYCAYD